MEIVLADNLLEGVKFAAIAAGGFVVFKKLKIMCTSQQEDGAHFRLKFRLKGFVSSSGAALADAVPLSVVAYSNPIEVFSHSQYLSNKTAGVVEVRIPSASVDPFHTFCHQVLPEAGPVEGGTRVVILGYNFRPNLQIKFGNTLVDGEFHESGALICTTPPFDNKRGGVCLVDVVDKEAGFCSHSPAKFIYV